jgi:ABC-2 type transport system permease protein
MSDSAIHDIGYQRYTGPRLGRSYERASLYTHSLRTAFGLGRSGKAKIFPWLVVSIFTLIAVIAVAVRSRTGQVVVGYVDLPQNGSLLLVLFVAAAAPELVSRDLRSKTLPLYFSRPLLRGDYAVAKLAAMISAVWLVIATPLTVMFLGAAFSLPHDKLWREFTDYVGGLIGGGITAIMYSVVALLVASLLGRRMVAAASIVAVFLLTTAMGAAVIAVAGGSGERIGRFFGPGLLTQTVTSWMLGGDHKQLGSFGWAYLIASLILVLICGGLLLVRYRKVAA